MRLAYKTWSYPIIYRPHTRLIQSTLKQTHQLEADTKLKRHKGYKQILQMSKVPYASVKTELCGTFGFRESLVADGKDVGKTMCGAPGNRPWEKPSNRAHTRSCGTKAPWSEARGSPVTGRMSRGRIGRGEVSITPWLSLVRVLWIRSLYRFQRRLLWVHFASDQLFYRYIYHIDNVYCQF